MPAEKGVPSAGIQAQIGHTSPAMVAYYTRTRLTSGLSVWAGLGHKQCHKRKGHSRGWPFLYFAECFGRGERIRTSDLSVPNRAHYQAVLRPEG